MTAKTYTEVVESEAAARQELWQREQLTKTIQSHRLIASNHRRRIEAAQAVIDGLAKISEIAGTLPPDVAGAIGGLSFGSSATTSIGCTRTHLIALTAFSAREAGRQIEREQKKLDAAQAQVRNGEEALAALG